MTRFRQGVIALPAAAGMLLAAALLPASTDAVGAGISSGRSARGAATRGSTARRFGSGEIRRLSGVTVLVKDQADALRWYRDKLGMNVVQDDSTSMPGFRWLSVAPKGQKGLVIALVRAEPAELPLVGRGTTMVLETDDCRTAWQTLKARDVEFVSEPEEMQWGVSALFRDLYGNAFNLVQRKGAR